MISRLVMVWDELRGSLWALPAAVVLAAAAMAVTALSLRLPPGLGPVWWLFSGNASVASGFLSSLLTAMITMATLAISITMVVLALAAQSLGPRLIPLFMGDTRTKLALGIFIGTVVYLLVVLRTVISDQQSVPQLAVTLGTALVVACVSILLFFVHHLARSTVADTIIDRVGATLDSYAASLMRDPDEAEGDAPPHEAAKDSAALAAKRSGYLQYVDYAAIVEAAEAADASVTLAYRPGQFIVADDAVAWVAPSRAADDDLSSAIAEAIVVGTPRTAMQDLEYSVRQLVEIALRALSPGINDPFTACAVIDRLTQSIAAMMKRRMPQTSWRDANGTARLFAPQTDLGGIFDVAFNQIRQAGASQPAILIRLVDRLGQLRASANREQTDAILDHIHRVSETGTRGVLDAVDRKVLTDRIAAAFRKGSTGTDDAEPESGPRRPA